MPAHKIRMHTNEPLFDHHNKPPRSVIIQVQTRTNDTFVGGISATWSRGLLYDARASPPRVWPAAAVLWPIEMAKTIKIGPSMHAERQPRRIAFDAHSRSVIIVLCAKVARRNRQRGPPACLILKMGFLFLKNGVWDLAETSAVLHFSFYVSWSNSDRETDVKWAHVGDCAISCGHWEP